MPDTPDDKEGRSEMHPAPAVSDDTDIVQVSTRVPKSLRQRMKVAAAIEDTSVQAILEHAMEEYLRRRNL